MLKVPGGALRAAVSKAETIARSRPEVLGVGEGVKRTGDQFAHRPSLCVKFLVDQKLTTPESPLPEAIDVRWRGTTYRLPTDVEEAWELEEQTLACFPDSNRRSRGTIGPLFETPVRRLALTAGHVLHRGTTVQIATGHVGTVLARASSLDTPDGLLDVGTIGLGAVPAACADLAPWNAIRSMLGNRRLTQWLREASEPRAGTVWGALGPARVVFVSKFGATEFGGRTYAPPIIRYESPDRVLRKGFSGSAVTSSDGSQLLGLHILGTTDGRSGFAQTAESFVSGVADALEAEVRLLRFDG